MIGSDLEFPGDLPIDSAEAEAHDASTIELLNTEAKVRLDVFLCQSLPGRSRSFVQKLIEGNWVNVIDLPESRAIKSSTTVRQGSTVRVTFPPLRKSDLEPEPIALDVLYEDSDIAVINKPTNLVMHPSSQQSQGTLVNRLLHHISDLSGIGGEERPGIVHRLDRDTSGVVVVAKNDIAHQELSRQFKEREIQKTYVAVLRGEWTAREGSIHLPIGRSITNRKRMMVRVDGQGKDSVTDYQIIEDFDGYAFAEVRPRTGRTHQIRVHMAKIRLPVACDGSYGREQQIFESDLRRQRRQPGETPLMARQALHAANIVIVHPTTSERRQFSAPLPADFEQLLQALRARRPPKQPG